MKGMSLRRRERDLNTSLSALIRTRLRRTASTEQSEVFKALVANHSGPAISIFVFEKGKDNHEKNISFRKLHHLPGYH